TMVLTRRGSDLHLLLHPRIDVRREPGGRLVEVLDGTDDADSARVAESYLHIEIDRERDAELDMLREELEHTLDDLRVVVDDWPALRARAVQLASEAVRRPTAGADLLDVA